MMFLNTQRYIYSNNKPFIGAIIGFGGVAEHAHAPILKKDPRFCIKAIVEPYKDRVKIAKSIFPSAVFYKDIDELFTHETLDFVDICTPPAYHADIIMKACENRVHIICEKPLVTEIDDLKRVLKASKEANVVLFCINNWKYAPVWSKVIELINKGFIGKIQKITLSVLRTPKSGGGITDWRKIKSIAGGGILMDHGWHHIYFINSITKGEPLKVIARMGYVNSNDSMLEDEVNLNIDYGNIQVNLYLTWRATLRKNFGYISGDKGEIIIGDDHLILRNTDSSLRYNFYPPLSKGSHHIEWMVPVIDDFFNELANKNNKRGDNLREAAICLHVISLAYRSQKNSCMPVKVSDIFND